MSNLWPRAALKELITISKELVAPQALAKLGDITLFSIPGFDAGAAERIPGDAIGSSKFRIPNDCVLLSKLNPRIPRVWRIQLEDTSNAFCSTEFLPLSRQDPRIDLDYLWHYLSSPLFLEHPSIKPASTTNSHERIDIRSLERFKIPLPDLKEQRQIASTLSSIKNVIEKTKDLITRLRALRDSTAEETLTKGLTGLHCHFQETKLGKLPATWQVIQLGEIAEVERGKFSHRPRNDPQFYGGPYPFIQTGDVAAGGGRIEHYRQTLNDKGLTVSRLFPAGTILMTIAANIGHTGIAMFDVAFPDSLVGITAGPRIDSRFLEIALRLRKRELEAMAPENAQKNINLQMIRPLLIPLPEPDEQRMIADAIETIESYRRSEVAYLERLRATESALSAALLSGEIRVAPDPEPEPATEAV